MGEALITRRDSGAKVTIDGEKVNNKLNLINAIGECEISTLPYACHDGSAVVFNNEIHILGGGASAEKTLHYKWNGSEWTQVSTLPYNFYDGSAVVLNDEIHILGGGLHYKWNGSEWTQVSTLPNPSLAWAVVLGTSIHMTCCTTANKSIMHYKWNGSEWTQVSTLPNPSWGCSAVVFNNEIHILGGSYTSTCEKQHYKWNGSEWTQVSTLPYNFYDGSAVVLNDEIHILGGDVSSGTNYLPRLRYYIWDDPQWALATYLPYFFYNGSAVVLNDEIHILGGGDTDESYDKHYAINKKIYMEVKE